MSSLKKSQADKKSTCGCLKGSYVEATMLVLLIKITLCYTCCCRMVRVLVSTALRESVPAAAAQPSVAAAERLLLLCRGGDRRDTAIPGPAAGLCFAGAEYT